MASSETAASTVAPNMITEDEASLYDRQIRLWGLEAQNRMRSSTILILTLRSLSQETIKNLVLAGVGKLIVMDDADVTEDDLGAGLLFREEDGDVGKKRVLAALPQIKSLNPLVQVHPISDFTSFDFRSGSGATSTATNGQNGIRVDETEAGGEGERAQALDQFLVDQKVDLVCATDLSREEYIKINDACRRTGKLFYAAGTYGYLGYIFSDLGGKFEWVMQAPAKPSDQGPRQIKKRVRCVSLSKALEANPFKGLTRNSTKEKLPANYLGALALWDFEKKHGGLPNGEQGEEEELMALAEGWRVKLEINEKALASVPKGIIHHLSTQSPNEFSPTAAILGGLLAQDVLRALSKKEKPVLNFLVADTMAGSGACVGWGIGVEEET